MKEERVGRQILDCAFRVHSALGPGLLENAYEACLAYELAKRFNVRQQVAMPLRYEGVHLDVGYRVDLLVENCVVVELKTVGALNDLHLAQILSYLRLGNYRLGYLLNFNVERMKDGIRRVVNGL